MDAKLENVLDAYAAAEPGPGRATLGEWIREYPQFARELTEFTARWQLLEWTEEAPAADARAVGDTASNVLSDEDRLILRGISAAQSAFYVARAERQASRVQNADAPHVRRAERAVGVTSPPAVADATITSLANAAKRAGLSQDDLIDRVGLSDGLFRKIDRRLIDPLTIPVRVLGDLAGALGRDVSAMAAYTQLPPIFATGAQHRANQAPTLPSQREDFFDAVRKDLAIDESRRQNLLTLPRPGADDRARTSGVEEG